MFLESWSVLPGLQLLGEKDEDVLKVLCLTCLPHADPLDILQHLKWHQLETE